LRQHGRTFDNDGLNEENAQQDKNDDDQKYVAKQFQAFGQQSLTRFPGEVRNGYITVVSRRDEAELCFVFAPEVEHNLRAPMHEGNFLSSDRRKAFVKGIFKMNEQIRSQFAAAQKYAYMNSAAVSPPPKNAIDAVLWQLRDVAENGTLHYQQWVETKERCRRLAAEMLCVEPEQVAFVRNTSDGFASIANGIDWSRGGNIVTFAEEFPANYYAWRRIRDDLGVELRICPAREDGGFDHDTLISLIDGETKAVAVSAVQFGSGFQADLERIGRAAHAVGALFCVDIIQAFGAMPLDLPSLGVDAACGASHKWLCAPEGVGIIYLSEKARERVRPTLVGWISVEDAWNFEAREQPLRPNALAWESGTGPASLFYGFEQSLLLLRDAGAANIRSHLFELGDRLCSGLEGRPYEVVSSRNEAERSQIVCLRHTDGVPAHHIYRYLEARGIIVSARSGRLRISPHFYNNADDIDRLLAELPDTL
jgi:selenocysteine lyase/cysteine desulfurase